MGGFYFYFRKAIKKGRVGGKRQLKVGRVGGFYFYFRKAIKSRVGWVDFIFISGRQ